MGPVNCAGGRYSLLTCACGPQVVLTAADGLSNPTDVAVRGDSMYVTSGAYFTRHDPNLLVAHLDR